MQISHSTQEVNPIKESTLANNLVWFLLGDMKDTIDWATASVSHYLEMNSTGNFHHALAKRLIQSQNPTTDGENMSERVKLLQEDIQDSLRSLIWNAVESANLHRSNK